MYFLINNFSDVFDVWDLVSELLDHICSLIMGFYAFSLVPSPIQAVQMQIS